MTEQVKMFLIYFIYSLNNILDKFTALWSGEQINGPVLS